MTTQFTLIIRMGNDLMHNGRDVAKALRDVASDGRLTDAEPLDSDNEFIAKHSGSTGILDDNGGMVGSWRIAEHLTDEEIAQQVLDNHAIKPYRVCNGEQVRLLLEEAVRISRGEE